MNIILDPVATPEDEDAVRCIRREAFGKTACCAALYQEPEPGMKSFHLLARIEANGDPVAALSVIETTGDNSLHEIYGLSFESQVRVARYTQMAVVERYRGLNLPLILMLEAHHRFIAVNGFDYSWLLFDADRAASSLICRLLGFTQGDRIILTDTSKCRALVRDERVEQARLLIRRAERYIGEVMSAQSHDASVFQLPAR